MMIIYMERHPNNAGSWRIGENRTYHQRGQGNLLVDAAIDAMEAHGMAAGYVTVVYVRQEEKQNG